MTIALVDGDIVAYRASASAEKDDERIALIRAHRTLQDIVSVTGADEIKVFLSGSTNFRKDIYPEYKANRDHLPRPRFLQAVREFIVLDWSAEVTDGYEADDALGVASQEREIGSSIVCSIDKDLRQLPGVHYNFVTGEFSTVDEIEGWRNFYKQLVLGDRGDNVPGFDGKMRLKFPKFLFEIREALDRARNVSDMYGCVKTLYKNDETLLRNGRLLYIWRKLNDQWSPPEQAPLSEEKLGVETKSASMPTTVVESSPSTERGGTKRNKDGSSRRGTRKGSRSRKNSRAR